MLISRNWKQLETERNDVERERFSSYYYYVIMNKLIKLYNILHQTTQSFFIYSLCI